MARTDAHVDGGGVALGFGHPVAAGVILGEHQVDGRLVATRAQVGVAGLGGAFEVAAPPAHLGQVGEGLAVERAGAGHLLERGAGERQETSAQVDARESGIRASLRDIRHDDHERHRRRYRHLRERARSRRTPGA